MPSPLRTFASLADDLPFLSLDPYERRWVQLTWRGVLLALLVLGAYAWTLNGGWLWQDEPRLVNDLRLRTLGGLKRIWTHPFSRAPDGPLTATLWWFEHAVARSSSAALHRGVSLALHAWTCVAFWLALRRLNVSAAWLIAAVIAVHPALLPIVAWPSKVGSVLGAASAMTALVALLRARDVEPPVEVPDDLQAAPLPDEPQDLRWPTWAAFWLCAAATPLADPVAAIALATAMPLALRAGGVPVGRMVGVTSAAIAIAGVAAGTAVGRHGAADSLATLMAVPRSIVAATYPPASSTLIDEHAVSTAHAFGVWLAAALWLGVVAAMGVRVGRGGRSQPLLMSGVGVLLASGVAHALFRVTHVGQLVTDVCGYLPVLAAVACGVGALAAVIRQLGQEAARPIRSGLGALLIVLAGGVTLASSRAFVSQGAFWEHAAAQQPSPAIRRAAAGFWIDRGQPARAATLLDSVDESQRGAAWLVIRGRADDAQGRVDAAIAAYAEAHRREPADAEALIALADAQRRAGRPNAAALLFEEYLARFPNDAAIHNELGLAYKDAGDLPKATEAYEAAIRLDPSLVSARLNFAFVLFAQQRFEESADQLQRATEIDPRNFSAFMTSGTLLVQLGDLKSAERMFRVAAAIDPESADAYDHLGATLAAQGDAKLPEAIWSFTRAARLRPADTGIAQRLAAVKARVQAAAATQRATR